MTREEILCQIRALPPADRLHILRELCGAGMTGYCGMARRQGIDESFTKYRDAMKRETGVDCTERTRRAATVWARNIVAFEMMNDGYVHTEIARRLGLSHTTLVYCKANVLSMLENPQFYRKEMKMYQLFKQAIK